MVPNIRTRFAPSPTGYMHIGNLRTAIYAYLIAKKYNGKFVLRIEDTDHERYVADSIKDIYRVLKTVGLCYDEGPDIGGPYGPYIQSDRKDIYKKYAKELVNMGHAYYCFCKKDWLDASRKECENQNIPYRYSGLCRNLSKNEVNDHLQNGESFVIRQAIPLGGRTEFHDLIYGSISVENSELDEGVLLKSDGFPTYNFANIIDDHLMEISHVIRGSEYLSSTPKYDLIYRAFNWKSPQYIHLPLIMKSEGKKLSKRDGDASFDDFIKKGYISEAIINYIVLLGWNSGNDEEFYSLQDLITKFNIEGISKSPSIFDQKKLKWMNGEYLRKKSQSEFHSLATPYYKNIKYLNINLEKVSALIQTRITILSEIPELLSFVDIQNSYDVLLYSNKKARSNPEIAFNVLECSANILFSLSKWKSDEIYNALIETKKKLNLNNSQIFWVIRIALSGKETTPGGAIEIAEILGKDESLRRINIGIDKLKRFSSIS